MARGGESRLRQSDPHRRDESVKYTKGVDDRHHSVIAHRARFMNNRRNDNKRQH
jgi:hypothetical protein